MNTDFLTDHNFLFIKSVLCFFLAASITFISIPHIIKVSIRKRLMDIPGKRSSHIRSIPNLGGIGIFFALIVSTSIFASELGQRYIFFFASLVILFFVGFLDDILIVRARVKLYAQILTAFMLVVGSGVIVKSFFGLLGIWELPYFFSVAFTLFIFITLINSYNLIDGIDGLAAGVGIISAVCFIYIFYTLGDESMLLLSVALLGSLISFLYFNLSHRLKVFMGDTGSMVVGFVITFMLIRFINLSSNPNIKLGTSPMLAVAIFIIPIVDTLSVFAIRVLNGVNPFTADKNHLHHRFLDLGFSHLTSAILICSINVFMIGLAYYFRHIPINHLFVILVPTAFFLSYSPLLFKRYVKK